VRFPPMVNRMARAAALDANLYNELEPGGASTIRQALVVALLAALATVLGAGLAGVFRWAGAWSLLILLIGLLGLVLGWLAWSLAVHAIGTGLSRGEGLRTSRRATLRALGFATSPGLLGLLLFVPVLGGVLWLTAFAWTLAGGVVAARQVLRLTTGRALLACLSGLIVCLLLGLIVLVPSSACLLGGGCVPGTAIDRQVNSIVAPHRFSVPSWEVRAITHELGQLLQDGMLTAGDPAGTVTEWFSGTEGGRVQGRNAVEKMMEQQIADALQQLDLLGFPPVNMRLTTLPRLLVISPRDRIETMREILLEFDLSLAEMESIETRVDELDVSSLVVRLGGYGGAYPSFVSDSSSLHATIETAVEEWVHQYLAFQPLGFRYMLDLLGIARDYDIATMNETAASMIAGEVASAVMDSHYPGHVEAEDDTSAFDREMREIRLAVDRYLARGEVEAAELFMEQERQRLVAEGYRIRKLNQAYFAWHGTYADEPGSVSPIGIDLRELRSRCRSVKEFMDTVAAMNSRQDLRDAVESLPQTGASSTLARAR